MKEIKQFFRNVIIIYKNAKSWEGVKPWDAHSRYLTACNKLDRLYPKFGTTLGKIFTNFRKVK
jgi:hypothetical protein